MLRLPLEFRSSVLPIGELKLAEWDKGPETKDATAAAEAPVVVFLLLNAIIFLFHFIPWLIDFLALKQIEVKTGKHHF